MIEKILEITNVGLLKKGVSTPLTLERLVLVYGENERGKTTFAEICRSLATGKDELITSRKTRGQSDEPKVRFLIHTPRGKQEYRFERSWSDRFPGILVFDDNFVEENVYIGSRIESSQREALFEFVLGEMEVDKRRKIDHLSELIDHCEKEIRELKKQISLIKGPFSLEEFVNLQPRAEIHQLLESKRAALYEAERKEAFRQRPEPVQLPLPTLEMGRLKELIESSGHEAAVDAVEKVRKHMERCMGSLHFQEEQWLREGLEYLEISKERCPFCGQMVTDLDLVEAYRQYFSESRKALEREVRRLKELLDRELKEIEHRASQNDAVRSAWSDKPEWQFPIVDLKGLKENFGEIQQMLDNLMREREKVSEIVESIEKKCEDIRSIIDRYNVEIKRVRDYIQQFKADLGDRDVRRLRSEIEKLEAERRRSEQEGLVREYRNLTQKKKNYLDQRRKLRRELDKRIAKLMREYQEKINEILEGLYARFRISECSVEHTKGIPKVKYGLKLSELHNGDVEFQALSVGARRTLALAFFLARLDKDQNLGQRIVVVDDPVSSLDYYRRGSTCKILAEKAQQACQLIVLSHDLPFLISLKEEAIRKGLGKGHVCEVEIKRAERIFSSLETVVFDQHEARFAYNDYLWVLYCLQRYLDSGEGDKKDIASKIRKYIEYALCFAFPPLSKQEGLSKMIVWLEKGGYSGDMIEELKELKEFSDKFHHAEAGSRAIEPSLPSDDELKRQVERALTFFERHLQKRA